MTLPISYDLIDRGTVADDGNGDDPRTWAGKTNDNATKLFETPTLPYLVVDADKTLSLADIGVRQWVDDADPVTLTLPAESTTDFPVGVMIPCARLGAGTVTIAAATGVSLNGVSAGSTAIADRYTGAVVEKIGADAWMIAGNIGTVA